MSVETKSSVVQQEIADFDAAIRHAFEGEPLDPQVEQRIQERAKQVTEEILRLHGPIDEETLNQLLRDSRDES